MPHPFPDPFRRTGPLSPTSQQSVEAIKELAAISQGTRRHVTGNDNAYTTPGGMVIASAATSGNVGPGGSIAAQNADGFNQLSPVALLIADNRVGAAFDDTHKFGRIFVSPGAQANSAQLDWQGQRVNHAGVWFGPEPDLEVVDNATVTWFVRDDPVNQVIILEAVANGTGLPPGPIPPWPVEPPVPIQPVYPPVTPPPQPTFPPPDEVVWIAAFNWWAPTNLTYPLLALIADNTLSLSGKNPAFGRIYFSIPVDPNGNPYTGATVIDWQGFFVYHASQGYIGPEPDWEIIDNYGIVANVVDAPDVRRTQVNLQVALSTTSNGPVSGIAFLNQWQDIFQLPLASPDFDGALWHITAQCSVTFNAYSAGDYCLFRLVDQKGNQLGCPLPCAFAFCAMYGIRGSCTLTVFFTGVGSGAAVKLQAKTVGNGNDLGVADSCQTADSGCWMTATRVK